MLSSLKVKSTQLLIYKINIQLCISFSISHSHSTTNSLFNITISQSSRPLILVQTCSIRLSVNIVSFSFCCFPILVLCRLAVWAYRWMLQHQTLFASVRSGGFRIASFGQDLIGVSIYLAKDSIYFKTQTKQRLRCLRMSFLRYLDFGLFLSLFVDKGLLTSDELNRTETFNERPSVLVPRFENAKTVSLVHPRLS
jgi:hypothetical protein